MGIWSAKIFGLWKLPHCDRCQVQLSDSCPGFCPIGFPIKYQFREKNSIPLLKPLSLPPSPGWINWYQESQEATHASLSLCSGSPTLSPLSPLPCHWYSGRRSLFTNLSPSISKPLTLYILLQGKEGRGWGVDDVTKPWKTLKLEIGVCLYNIQVKEGRGRGKLSPELQYCVPGNWGDISWTKPYLKKKKKSLLSKIASLLCTPQFLLSRIKEGKESSSQERNLILTIFFIDSSAIRKWRNQSFDVIVFISASLLLFIETQKRKRGKRLFNTSFKKTTKTTTTNFPKCLRTIKRKRRFFWSIN